MANVNMAEYFMADVYARDTTVMARVAYLV